MSLTLTPVLIQFVSWGTYTIGGLTALLLIILVIWHYIRPQRSTPSVPSAPPFVLGQGLELKHLKLSSNASNPYDAPLPPRWKNGQRLPPETESSDEKPLNESSDFYETNERLTRDLRF